MQNVILGADIASHHVRMVLALAKQVIHLQKEVVSHMLIDSTS